MRGPRQKITDIPWDTSPGYEEAKDGHRWVARFTIQCSNFHGEECYEDLVEILKIVGVEILDERVLRIEHDTKVHDLILKYPSPLVVERKVTRYAGRRCKRVDIPKESLFKCSDTVGTFLDWFDRGDGKGHTDAEGMEQLGIASKSTFRRWVQRAREKDRDCSIELV